MDKYEINKEIVFSTAHLWDEDISILEDIGLGTLKEDLSVIVDNYSIRIYVSQEAHNKQEIYKKLLKGSPLSKEFWNIMMLASTKKCKWLVFDRDGKIYKNFPVCDD